MSEVAEDVVSEEESPKKKGRIDNQEGQGGDLSSLLKTRDLEVENVQDGDSIEYVSNDEELDVQACYEIEEAKASRLNELYVHMLRAIIALRSSVKFLDEEIEKRLHNPYYTHFTFTLDTASFLTDLRITAQKEPLEDGRLYMQEDLIVWLSNSLYLVGRAQLLFRLLTLDKEHDDPLHVAREEDTFIFQERDKIVPFERDKMLRAVLANRNVVLKELAEQRKLINELVTRPMCGLAASVDQGAALRRDFFDSKSQGSIAFSEFTDRILS